MKSNKSSKKNFKYSDIEKSDIDSQTTKGVRKDKSTKRRLSIYDEFEDESYDEFSDMDDSYDDE